MTDEFTSFEGQRMIITKDDGRYSCINAYVEEVDYPWFTSTDGEKVVLPVDENDELLGLPVVMCFIDDDGKRSNKAHGCYGREHCKFYQKVQYDQDMEQEDEE